MATLTLHQLGDHIAGLTLRDAQELSQYLQDAHGISPPQASGVVREIKPAPPAEPARTSFDVVLVTAGANKVVVIRAIAKILGMGLMEARTLVDRAPTPIQQHLDADRAAAIKQQIEDAGGVASVE